MKKENIYTISLLSIFLAISILLNYVENFLPMFIPIPGVKLGIANIIGLIVLYFFGRKKFILLNFLRVIIVGVLFNGIFTSSFFLSFSGFLCSSFIAIILSYNKKISIYTLSIASSIFHSIGQILCACIIYSSVYLLYYLSILVITSSIAGFLIAYISSLIIKRLEKIIPFQLQAK